MIKNVLLLILTAIITSAVVVSFLNFCQVAVDHFRILAESIWWLPLVWTPLLTILIVYVTLRYAPGTAGSGNQQIKAALDDRCDDETKSKFVSLKVATFKYFSTAAGFFAGLSIGREGPTVQIASSLMHSIRGFLPAGSKFNPNFLIGVGGAIGIAVAFKAVIAGTVFALEETSKVIMRDSRVMFFTLVTFAIITCYALEGTNPFYAMVIFPKLTIFDAIPIIITTIIGAGLGGLFAKALLFSMPSKETILGRFKGDHPLMLAGILGLIIAVIGIVFGGMTYSDGYNYTKGLVTGDGEFSYWFVPMKFIATWFTAWTGVPAGMFSPLLSIGAGIGQTMANLLIIDPKILLLCGMASFLSGVIRAPLTAGFLAVEVLGAHALIPLALLVSLLSDKISSMVSKPLWLTQRDILLFNSISRKGN